MGFALVSFTNSKRVGNADNRCDLVDGGAWRIASSSPGLAFQYPDFLLSDQQITGVRGRKPKL